MVGHGGSVINGVDTWPSAADGGHRRICRGCFADGKFPQLLRARCPWWCVEPASATVALLRHDPPQAWRRTSAGHRVRGACHGGGTNGGGVDSRSADRSAGTASPVSQATGCCWVLLRRLRGEPVLCLRSRRGFHGRRQTAAAARRCPGQYLMLDLLAADAPISRSMCWTFEIRGAVDEPTSWTWSSSRRCRASASPSTSTA